MVALKAPAEQITIPVKVEPENFKWLSSTWRLCLSVGIIEGQNDDDDDDDDYDGYDDDDDDEYEYDDDDDDDVGSGSDEDDNNNGGSNTSLPDLTVTLV